MVECLGLTQARADGCVFFDLSDGRKSGRHVDDFLISGLHAALEWHLRTTAFDDGLARRGKTNDSSGILLRREIVRIDCGFEDLLPMLTEWRVNLAW